MEGEALAAANIPAAWLAVPAVLAVASLLLAIPLNVVCSMRARPAVVGGLRVEWLFGLVRLRRRCRRSRSLVLPRILRTAEGRRRAFDLLRAVGRRIRLRRLEARLRVGLGDPADTGLLMGMLLPPTILLRQSFPGSWEVTPDFAGAALEGRVEAALRVVPLRLIGPLLSFALWMAWHGSLRARASA